MFYLGPQTFDSVDQEIQGVAKLMFTFLLLPKNGKLGPRPNNERQVHPQQPQGY